MGMKRIKKALSVFLAVCMTLMQMLWSGAFVLPAYAATGSSTLTEDSNLFNLEAEDITFGENAKITFTFPKDTKGEVCLGIYDFEESLVAEEYYSLSSDMQGKVEWTPEWTPEDIPVGFYEAYANFYSDDDEYDYELVLGFSSGFEPNSSEFVDSNGDGLCLKWARIKKNSAMNEYDIDYEMPYDEVTGDVWDSENSVNSYDETNTVEWLIKDFTEYADQYLSND